MGLKALKLQRVANRFQRVFMDECHVDLFRSEKVFDEVGGDIEITHDEPIYSDIPCYFSQHPWYTTAIEDHPGYLNMRGNYRFHFFIKIDIREGDVIKVNLDEYPNLPAEQYMINKVAYYPTHIRCECGIWQPRE